MSKLHIDGSHMQVRPPPALNREEEECLDFKGPAWIEPTVLKAALRKN